MASMCLDLGFICTRIIGGHSVRGLRADRDASFRRMQDELPTGRDGPWGFLFSGHANYSMGAQGRVATLAFTNSVGKIDAPLPSAHAIASVLRGVPSMTLVFLNGCESRTLGEQIKADTGILNIVCWRTEVDSLELELCCTLHIREQLALHPQNVRCESRSPTYLLALFSKLVAA